MTEKELQEELAAIDRAGKRVTATKESSLKFLQELGILDEKGELTPFFKDYEPAEHDSSQSDPGIPRV